MERVYLPVPAEEECETAEHLVEGASAEMLRNWIPLLQDAATAEGNRNGTGVRRRRRRPSNCDQDEKVTASIARSLPAPPAINE